MSMRFTCELPYLLQDVDAAAMQLRAGAAVRHQPRAGPQPFDDTHSTPRLTAGRSPCSRGASSPVLGSRSVGRLYRQILQQCQNRPPGGVARTEPRPPHGG